jgi:redox-sensitive bicupin YhaK (pirin superfamily)
MNNPIKEVFKLGFPWQTEDPFLFCVYHLDHYPKGKQDMSPDASLEGRNLGNDFTVKDGWRMYHGQTIPGFPAHPHRGFETITIVNKGFCDHSDSLGAAGRFGEGDVQWMTAGKGVQHCEMFPLVHTDKENPLELFQIWLNLPKANKFVEPHFKMLWHEDIPIIKTDHASIKVIAGHYGKEKAPEPAPDSWATKADNHVAILNIHIAPNGTFTLPKTAVGVNRTLYFYEGDAITIESTNILPNHGITLDAMEEVVITAGNSEAHLLILQGKPIAEPVVKYGPFVMNTEAEIQSAMEEYRQTQFGGWPWRHPDHAHDRDKGRFAKYPDGTLVEKT